jgi:hypothetical protein
MAAECMLSVCPFVVCLCTLAGELADDPVTRALCCSCWGPCPQIDQLSTYTYVIRAEHVSCEAGCCSSLCCGGAFDVSLPQHAAPLMFAAMPGPRMRESCRLDLQAHVQAGWLVHLCILHGGWFRV